MAIDKAALVREQLDETQQGWLLGPRDVKKDKYIDLWIVVCKKEMVKWVVYSLLIAFVVIGVPIIVAKMMPKPKEPVLLSDEYTVALRLALEFFNAQKYSTNPDDEYCWQRPEDMNYPRPVLTSTSAPDLGSEVAAALAAASLVFTEEDTAYSTKLVKAAKTAYRFATESGQQAPYSSGNQQIARFYNSTGYWDEFIWASAWLFYATGNYTYLSRATDPRVYQNANASFLKRPDSRVFSWDNKLPAAQLLLSRIRVFLNPGYPYEDMLKEFHANTDINMCSYLRQFNVFNWTKGNFICSNLQPASVNRHLFLLLRRAGGLAQLNRGRPRSLQYAANAAFLASLYADYMNDSQIQCCFRHHQPNLSLVQINYILGANPGNMSYLVGYGKRYPKHVRHRGASTPSNGRDYSCTGGWTWRDSKAANPNVITGAMVGGPDKYDRFFDERRNGNYTEPTLAGNAGLVAALVSLTSSGGGVGVDRNTIFSAVPSLRSNKTPPPSNWHP
ncbi:hypothetical protein BHE74_00012497 [Ensete ventricosum]|uniref:cellulase n=1 Tax=Ensete ventricosum TaxID=4639 RepID=A0A445M986_ENSVE|nr:hypothetical protein BHE74_00012497 [Ensete ventricosum]RZR70797.1 hypothetical protein BHM03_00001535 [Ensete ventricosum]